MTTQEYLISLGEKAKQAKTELALLSAEQKNAALLAIADTLLAETPAILAANNLDTEAARAKGTSESMIDRLTLDETRIAAMAQGVRDIAALPDPIGEVLETVVRPNGLQIQKVRVPMGVIGIIFESRPNVTSDAAAICLKAGSAVILRGGKEAIHSNTAIVAAMKKALREKGLNENMIGFVEDTTRESSNALIGLNGYIDLLIPRGGAGLISNVVQHATVPVIQTGTGNCHAYVHESADFDMALGIIYNGKTSRPSVCNALESVVIDTSVAQSFLPLLVQKLSEKEVQIVGDETACRICPEIKPASEKDYYTEFLDYKLSVKTVNSVAEAIAWVNEHSTMHSEVIIAEDKAAADQFLTLVDSSSVYHNASTRFTDGGEFGLGAEIGISTQKLHARGPMGIKEITSYKYIIKGEGQVR
ncbi:MAG: glutamate-5-semialdehyde dehydrogenase [Clostridia bacterium]|nr:glutamate-5-semialdehyde dehydrogenase [Clostridia bacterium]